MEVGYVLIFIIMGLGLTYVISYFSQQGIMRAWQRVAEQTGLTCEVTTTLGIPRSIVTGGYRGYPLVMDTYTVGSGKHRHTYTRVVLTVENRAGGQFALGAEGFFSGLGKMLGAQDIQTGDEELDKRLIVKGAPETFALSILNSMGLRQKLLEGPIIPSIKLDGNRLYHTELGVQTNVERLQFIFDVMADVADGAKRAG